MAHLYTLLIFHILLLNDHCTLGLILQIPGSIISHFIFLSPKYFSVTHSTLIHPYSVMYCRLSRDGVLHLLDIMHHTHEGRGFDHWVFEFRFPLILLPFYPEPTLRFES